LTLAAPLPSHNLMKNNITDFHEFTFALGETVGVCVHLMAFEALYMM